MPEKELPARPSLEQYKKQAKDLLHSSQFSEPAALERFAKHLPQQTATKRERNKYSLTDAQLVIAREHGFESWPKFTRQIELVRYQNSADAQNDPVKAFIEAGCVPRDGNNHHSGTLDLADAILAEHPEVASANIYTAAILGDDKAVTRLIAENAGDATRKGGPYEWDALTYLCFSRYLRLDKARSDGFVQAARSLLDRGASAKTGWFENDHQPHPEFESVIYGAAAVAQNADLTRLLLDRGADPNDAETPYHVAESYDLAVLQVLLESGKLNPDSLTTILLRKADVHDLEGVRLLLAHGADPNRMTRWGYTALHQALRRDNCIELIDLMLDHGADPTLKNEADGKSGIAMAARRGRSDALWSFARRGFPMPMPSDGLEHLIVIVCEARGGIAGAGPFLEQFQHVPAGTLPELSELGALRELIAEGSTLLAEFAGNGNTRGVQQVLELGVPVNTLYGGDPYFDIAKDSTALHVAAWKARPVTVKLLIDRGADVNAQDGKGRTPLMLAVKACVDSYWTDRRTPESVEALLKAGASTNGIEYPCGYEKVDELLKRYRDNAV